MSGFVLPQIQPQRRWIVKPRIAWRLLPWQAAAAGNPNIKDQFVAGVGLNGRKCRNHVDGHNRLDSFSGKTDESPRNEFICVNNDSQIVALCYDAWKTVFLENRGVAPGVWLAPFTELRVPLLFNLCRDPFERAQHNSNTCNARFLDRAFTLVPMWEMAGKFLMTMKDYPPSQTPGSFNLEKIQQMIEAGGGSWQAWRAFLRGLAYCLSSAGERAECRNKHRSTGPN